MLTRCSSYLELISGLKAVRHSLVKLLTKDGAEQRRNYPVLASFLIPGERDIPLNPPIATPSRMYLVVSAAMLHGLCSSDGEMK